MVSGLMPERCESNKREMTSYNKGDSVEFVFQMDGVYRIGGYEMLLKMVAIHRWKFIFIEKVDVIRCYSIFLRMDCKTRWITVWFQDVQRKTDVYRFG